MQLPKPNPEKFSALSNSQREIAKSKLLARQAKIKAELAAIADDLKAIRNLEEIVGHVTINEYLAGHHVELSVVQKSRLGDLLKKGAHSGKWEQGKKTVKVENRGRIARQTTYEPSVIKGVLREMTKP